MTKNIRFFYIVSLICILQYIVTTSILFYFYHGASRYNFEYSSYVFFENFLSDLGRVTGFNGQKNVTAVYYASTLSLVGIGTLSFFVYIKHLFKSYVFSKYGLFIGAASGISLALVGVFAVDESRALHLTFLGIGYILFFITLLGYNILMFRDKEKFKNVLYLTTTLNLALFVYILILIFGGSPDESISSLTLQVVSQKVIVYGQLFILGGVLVLLKPKNEDYNSTK